MLNIFNKTKSPPLHQPPKINTTPVEGNDPATIQDILAPSAIEVDFSHIKVGDTYFRTLFAAGYPRYVSANWLSPLINFSHSLDVAMYIYPTWQNSSSRYSGSPRRRQITPGTNRQRH